MKKLIFITLLLLISIFPQANDYYREYIYSDIIYLPSDTTESVFLTYKIPYNSVVFEKEGELFKAEFRFAVEVFDSLQFITREIIDDQILTSDYGETDSREIFKEGYVKLKLDIGNYRLLPIFTDLNSNQEIKLGSRNLKIDPKSVFYQPLVAVEKVCEDMNLKLDNYDGNVPFDGKDHILIFKLKTLTEKINYEIFNNGSLDDQGEVQEVTEHDLFPVMCEGSISLMQKESEKLSFIKIKLAKTLVEGDLQVNILNDKREKLFSVNLIVRWYNKPKSLANKETAVRLLKIIDKDESFHFLDKDDLNFNSVLLNYWKKYDPTPNTSFNELMNEFYKRADYAEINFRSFSGKSGLESDRAKIYIQFGKPLSVDRFSNQKGKIIEIWYYADNKKFSFIDEKGTGEFNLLNS